MACIISHMQLFASEFENCLNYSVIFSNMNPEALKSPLRIPVALPIHAGFSVRVTGLLSLWDFFIAYKFELKFLWLL